MEYSSVASPKCGMWDDHPGGEPPQLHDRGARSHALRGCPGDGGVRGPGPQADLQGGHHPALCASAGTTTHEVALEARGRADRA